MKRLILLLTLVIAALASAAQSSLYERYAQRADLTVAQVSGFRLSDTVRIDVVLIVANDAQAWQTLSAELQLPDTEGVSSWLAPIDEPSQRTRWAGQPLLRVVASPGRRTIGLYLIDTETQYDALIDYQMNTMARDAHRKHQRH